ncbi:TPA: restriction endonuclease subunit S [Proteus mirabilis]|nr:restriction endonuclease subunit S [Proteus mirabilis]
MMKISEMPKYEVYKDSGVEWLGDIPASWSLLANKHIFRLKKKQVGKRSSEYDLLSLTLRGVIKRDMENPEGKFPAEFDTYQEVRCGDFIFCLFDVEETPRTVGLSPFNGMITGAYTVFELNDNFDNRFLYYFYMNLDAKKMLKPLYRGLRNTIPKDSFLSFKTFVPPHEQQTRIANFLDKKTALIDEAISIKEKQINLLKERKQIIIQQAVTQGLDPNVPMKDSGVDWIGKIPEHWNLKSLKRVVKEHSGNGFPIELQGQAGDIPFLKVSDLSCEGILVDKSSNRVSHKVVQKQKWNIVPAGSLVTAKIGEALRKNHRKLLAYDSIIDNNCIAFECVKIEKKYNFYLHLVIDFDWFVNPGAVPSISVSKYKSQKVVVPSMKEQVLIANFLDKKTALIDEAISIKEKQIEKLKEYKTTLINSAVTGKIKITPEMVEQ